MKLVKRHRTEEEVSHANKLIKALACSLSMSLLLIDLHNYFSLNIQYIGNVI